MTLSGTRFGAIDFQTDDVIRFDGGLIGFAALCEFLLVDHKPESPFKWLQSVDEPGLAFLVTEPSRFVPEYPSTIGDDFVLATVAIPVGRPDDMTLNLAGPILIHEASRTGKQVVLDDESYTVKHRVFAEGSAGVKAAA